MTASERLAQVEQLLGSELTEKHRTAVEFGVRARLTPKSIADAILRRESVTEAEFIQRRGRDS